MLTHRDQIRAVATVAGSQPHLDVGSPDAEPDAAVF